MFKKIFSKKQESQNVKNQYYDLRNHVFSSQPSDFKISPIGEKGIVWGFVMDWALSEVITLVALADGATSLYISNGGGFIGAGEHNSVAQVTKRLVFDVDNYLDYLKRAETFQLPITGKVRFSVLTTDGILTCEADEDDLKKRKHELSSLYYQAHGIIHQIRLIYESKKNQE